MNKPKRSDDKYWIGTRNFNEIQFISDLEDYTFSLESKIEQLQQQIESDKKTIEALKNDWREVRDEIIYSKSKGMN